MSKPKSNSTPINVVITTSDPNDEILEGFCINDTVWCLAINNYFKLSPEDLRDLYNNETSGITVFVGEDNYNIKRDTVAVTESELMDLGEAVESSEDNVEDDGDETDDEEGSTSEHLKMLIVDYRLELETVVEHIINARYVEGALDLQSVIKTMKELED